MSIYMSERTLSVKAPQIYCDACSGSLDLVGELTDIRITRSGERVAGFGSGYGLLFLIPGVPVTASAAMEAAITRGWSKEDLHGKEMLFCPVCALKPSAIERTGRDEGSAPTEAEE